MFASLVLALGVVAAASPVAQRACTANDWPSDRIWVTLNNFDDYTNTFYNETILGSKVDCPVGAHSFVWTVVDKATCAQVTENWWYADVAVYNDKTNKAVDSDLSSLPASLSASCADGASIYARGLFRADMTAPDAPKTGWKITFA